MDLLPAIFTFLMVVLILYLSYAFSKYVAKKGGVAGGFGGGKAIKVIDRAHIGQDKALLVVKVGEKMLLLGVGSNDINVLSDLDEANSKAVLDAVSHKNSDIAEPDFKKILKAALNYKNNKDEGKKP